jgi:hypothetical protein
MQRKFAVLARLGLVALIGAGFSCGQQQTLSPADQAKLTALKQARDSGALTAQEYDTKVQAIQAAASPATSPAKPPTSHSKISWPTGTHKADLPDPVYQMTAATLEVPSGWKFAGTVVREPGCHSSGAGLKYTAQSQDGLTAIVLLPGSAWSWSSDAGMNKIMEAQHCPGIDIDSAAKFLINIAVPNLRPKAKVLEVLPLLPQGQAALTEQLRKAREQNAAMARQYNAKPQKLTIDGARVHVQYDRDGQPVEEMITSVIDCNESTMPGVYKQPPYQQRMCSSRNVVVVRAPQGRLDELQALPQYQDFLKGFQINADWQNRLTRDQQAAFQQAQAANNAQFRANLKAGQDFNDRLVENAKAQRAATQASTDASMARAANTQAAIDASAHATANYSLDRQSFTNPSTGQTIEASSEYNHQWMSSDGSTLIQTNDHTFDPNGAVYPVSQSWTELVPK